MWDHIQQDKDEESYIGKKKKEEKKKGKSDVDVMDDAENGKTSDANINRASQGQNFLLKLTVV